MFVSGKIKKAFVISDTCSAGTLFSTTDGDKVKAILVGSSEWDDYALSSGFDKYIGQPLKDKFSYSFYQFLGEMSKKRQKMNFEKFI